MKLSRVPVLLGALAVAIAASVTAAASAQAEVFTNPATITIPASGVASPYPSAIAVSGLTGQIADVNVTLNRLSDQAVDDVGVVLVGPGGQALLLLDGGGTSSPITPLTDVTTTFDDQAGSRIPNTNGGWVSGSFRPTTYYTGDAFDAPGPGVAYASPGPLGPGTATLGSVYAGTNPNGTWSLYVKDFASPDSGTISGWSIDITTDSLAPETTLASGPPTNSNSSSATFAFTASEPGTFLCKIDTAAFSACTSPQAYSSLADGAHTFQVAAVDSALNQDASPATSTFTVDTAAPQTTIDSGPSGTIADTAASFDFSASEPADFDCKLDSEPFTSCTSPQSYTGLAAGQHTFKLRATDVAGNVDTTAASSTFTVDLDDHTPPPAADTTQPSVTITPPKPKKGKRSLAIAFSGSDDRTASSALAFDCALDDGSAQACTSPQAYSGLKLGRHTVIVVAIDAAGNVSRPAAASFEIKKKPKKH